METTKGPWHRSGPFALYHLVRFELSADAHRPTYVQAPVETHLWAFIIRMQTVYTLEREAVTGKVGILGTVPST